MSLSIERILVGLDAESRADLALVRGLELAKALGAQLEAVHAVPLDANLGFGGSAVQLDAAHAQLLSQAREHVTAALRPVLRKHGAEDLLPGLLRIQPGQPASVLIERAAASDLLLLGGHAKRRFFDLGGTARHVLAHVERPVWIQPCAVTPIKRIAVATDFSEHGGCAIAYAKMLATKLGAELNVVHCFAPPTFAYAHDGGVSVDPYAIAGLRDAANMELDALIENGDWGNLAVSRQLMEGPPLDSILEAGARADLTVLGTHGRTGLSRFVMGSVAQGALKHSTGALLVVPNRAASWILDSPEARA